MSGYVGRLLGKSRNKMEATDKYSSCERVGRYRQNGPMMDELQAVTEKEELGVRFSRQE